MDAWENLLVYSTAPEGSDAWTHLINQEGGGGGGEPLPCEDANFIIGLGLTGDITNVTSTNINVSLSASVDTQLHANIESESSATVGGVLSATVC